MFFAEAGDGVHFLRVTAFGLTEDDQAVITVLESIVPDKSKL